VVIDVKKYPSIFIRGMNFMLPINACNAITQNPNFGAEVFFGEEILEKRTYFLELRASLSQELPETPEKAFSYLFKAARESYLKRTMNKTRRKEQGCWEKRRS
jgi:hypothetical protein